MNQSKNSTSINYICNTTMPYPISDPQGNPPSSIIDNRQKRRLRSPTVFPNLFHTPTTQCQQKAPHCPLKLYSMQNTKRCLASIHENNFCFPITVNRMHKVTANLDTGAQVTTISKSFYDQLKQTCVLDNDPTLKVRLYGINGQEVKQPALPVNLVFGFEHMEFQLSVAVRSNGPPILFGMDFVTSHRVSFYFDQDGRSYITTRPLQEVPKKPTTELIKAGLALGNNSKLTLRPGINKIRVTSLFFGGGCIPLFSCISCIYALTDRLSRSA